MQKEMSYAFADPLLYLRTLNTCMSIMLTEAREKREIIQRKK